MRFSVFTVATPDVLGFAATLMASVRAFEPDAKRTIFVLADDLNGIEFPTDLAELVLCGGLGIPDYRKMTFAYTPFELATAMKPVGFQWLTSHRGEGVDAFVMIDSDIRLYAPLAPVRAALARAELVLTPHITRPSDSRPVSDETDLLRGGAFNSGFLALRPTPTTRRFIDWWGERLNRYCLVDIPRGLFVDQKWLDLAPSLVSSLEVLGPEGCNVAYWNIDEQPIGRDEQAWTAGGKPLVFFHFSGIGLEPPYPLSRHRAIERTAGVPFVNELADDYRLELERNGHANYQRHRYPYGSYPDGRPISQPARAYYASHMWDSPSDVADPFALGADYFDEVDPNPLGTEKPPLSRVMRAVWEQREDVRLAALDTLEGRTWFRAHFLAHGADYGVPDPRVPPVASQPQIPVIAPAPAPAAELEALSRELSELRSAHEALLARHQSVLRTLSWRVTAPLRWVLAQTRGAEPRARDESDTLL